MVCGTPDVRRVLHTTEGNFSETLLAGPSGDSEGNHFESLVRLSKISRVECRSPHRAGLLTWETERRGPCGREFAEASRVARTGTRSRYWPAPAGRDC